MLSARCNACSGVSGCRESGIRSSGSFPVAFSMSLCHGKGWQIAANLFISIECAMSDSTPERAEAQLRIVRKQGEIEPKFANNFVIQADGPEFHLRFYQIQPPIVLGESPEELRSVVAEMGGIIEAQCVAHLVVAKDRMEEIGAVIAENLKKHMPRPAAASDN